MTDARGKPGKATGEGAGASSSEGSSRRIPVQRAVFGDAPRGRVDPGTIEGQAAAFGLEMFMDVPLEITVELGRIRKTLKQVMELGVGSVVQLDKQAGDLVDVLVNGKTVARGEVVVVEANFGVRIRELVDGLEAFS